MTATLYPTPAHCTRGRGGTVATGCPNYARRRSVALLLAVTVLAVALVTLVALAGVAVDFGGRPAAASEIAPAGAATSAAPSVRIHVAEESDTLWSIAESYRGEVSRDRFVDALIDLNGGTSIQIGQAVHLP